MDMIFYIIGGLATAFNFMVIHYKFKQGYTQNALFDLFTFLAITILFAGTMSGMVIGMIASAILSVYLLMFIKDEKRKRSKKNTFDCERNIFVTFDELTKRNRK
jgi:Ca2+/Na+ antiporter